MIGHHYNDELASITRNMKVLLVNWLLTGLVSLAGIYADDEAKSLSGHLLEAAEVRVTSRVQTLWPNTDGRQSSAIIHVHEYYSNRQHRARLELSPVERYREVAEKSERQVIYFHDSQDGGRFLRWVKVGGGGDQIKCETSDINELASDLFGALSKMNEQFSGESWQDLGSSQAPKHIIGFGRLLFMIDQTQQLLSNPKKRGGLIIYQNSIEYDYNGSDLIPDLKIKVYYADTEQHTLGNDLPSKVVLRTENDIEMVIDFLQADRIHRDFFERQLELDLFAFPIGQGCSSSLGQSAPSLVNPEVTVASYQAKVVEYNRGMANAVVEFERFVAYDLLAKAVRFDTIHQAAQYYTDIYDLSRNHIYNILGHLQTNNDEPDGNRVGSSVGPQCIATSFNSAESYAKFFNFHQMIQMGRAIVRGLECMLFEQVTRDLPAALFPYLNYRDESGALFKRAFDQSDKVDQSDYSEPYSVVYYFVAQNSDPEPRLSYRDVALGPLVHVEVYQSGWRRYTFSVTNFVYQLADAPNGDKQVDLFALRDRCGAAKQAANYAKVTFELNYKRQPSSGSALEVAQLLASSMLRNKAIIRAISAASKVVSATKIYDIDSSLELREADNQLIIHGACRFVQADVESVLARVVGATDFRPTTSHRASSYEACFWEAARSRRASRSGRVLFVACSSHCMIDSSPEIIANATNSTKQKFRSQHFVIADQFTQRSCAVMLMESKEQEPPKSALPKVGPLEIWDQAYRTLRANTVHLALADDDETNLDKRLIFRVDQLEITNERWSSLLGYEVATVDGKHSLLENGELLKGIGLMPASGSRSNGAPSTSASLSRGTEMSHSVCHSICMANMSCNSFSVCVTARAIECITSEINVADSSILDLIKLKREELTKAEKTHQTIRVTTTRKHSDDENLPIDDQTDGSERTIELRLDARCKLYQRKALELFRMDAPTEVELNDASTRPARGPAECAELCLNSNLAFIGKMADLLAHQLITKSTKRTSRERELASKEYASNLSLWCSSFRYLNLLDSSVSKKELAEKINPAKLNQTGICSFMRPISSSSKVNYPPTQVEDSTPSKNHTNPNDQKQSARILFKQYRFIYTSLYQAQYGQRMVKRSVTNGDSVVEDSDKKIETVRLWASDVETCARACFLQTSSLKPSCKSFDFIHEQRATVSSMGIRNRRSPSSYCVLNSRSLADFSDQKDNILREINAKEGTSIWHYEPKDVYSIDTLAAARALASESAGDSLDGPYALSTHGFEHFGLWVLAAVVSAMVCSIVLVARKGETIVRHLHKQTSSSSSHSQAKRIRFQLPDHIVLDEINPNN